MQEEVVGSFRTKVYLLLSALFRYPSRDAEKFKFTPKILDKRFNRTLELLKELLKLSFYDETYEVEFTRLFISAYPKVPCPPYESFYKEGRLMGDCAMELRELYHAFNIDVVREMPDNVSVELEFMGLLTRMESFAERGNFVEILKVEEDMLRKHLTSWIPRFSSCVIKEAKVEFYRRAALLLKRFIEEDLRYVEKLLRQQPLT